MFKFLIRLARIIYLEIRDTDYEIIKKRKSGN